MSSVTPLSLVLLYLWKLSELDKKIVCGLIARRAIVLEYLFFMRREHGEVEFSHVEYPSRGPGSSGGMAEGKAGMR